MKDWIEKIIAFMPRYIDDLVSLISGPKRFVLKQTASDEAHLTDALVFLAISFVIGWVLTISFLKQDVFIELTQDASFVALYVVTFGGAVFLAWRCVRGVGDIKKHSVIHFYYAGVIKLILACGFMAIVGVFRASDPQLYEELIQAVYQGQAVNFMVRDEPMMESNSGMTLIAISWVFAAILLVWIIAGWGAYRELNQSSRFRSVAAFTLFIIFSVPVTALSYFIANAIG